eukprot:TRINITY_DN19058_c0_g1_i1.p1 TRINITY_DN19058_c0_g1~~TRINITY_DN19058_c0_g1_i1.p1  ORF type:complete len:385 (+),score=30.68 TRINITY_DN19058_c0_g1_i1:71-1225(+)
MAPNSTMTVTMTLDGGSGSGNDNTQNPFIFAGGLVLLYILLAGMAASVDTSAFRGHFKRPKPLVTGLLCQFICLPLLGYLSVVWMDVNQIVSVALLITCMSPGGAFSNWFCSLFNADLALSIAMTTCSTLLALAILPLNIYIYVSLAYGSKVVLDWVALFISVASAAAGMVTGILISWKRPHWRRKCNVAASFAGIALIIYGAFTSTTKAPLWNRAGLFYVQVATPCVLGVIISTLLTILTKLPGPTSVAIAIECGYQNTGIAMSIVMATFKGDDQGEALGVPLYYGTIQAIVLIIYNLVMWKMGRTYAPTDVSVGVMIASNYQPGGSDDEDAEERDKAESGSGNENSPYQTSPGSSDGFLNVQDGPRTESNPMVKTDTCDSVL